MQYKENLGLPKNVAVVHEWFSSRSQGGSENVVKSIDATLNSQSITPELFSLVDSLSDIPSSWLFNRKINTSFIQNLPFGRTHVQQYLPLLPYAIEQLDVSRYQLVISSNHLVAKGVITSPDQLHVSYVHTPVRYAWDQMHAYLRRSSLARKGLGPCIRYLLHELRKWDHLSATRVDRLLANSRFTARRISKFWGRDSTVLHPPVDVNRFKWESPREDTYLCLCRLVSYKRVDLVVEAFNRLNLPLVVVGDGPERDYLEGLAGPSVCFLGNQTDAQVQDLMAQCRAFVYAAIEDFGIAPVEAMASGAPVIGLGRGGLLDTVSCLAKGHSCPTGVLFAEQTVEAIVEAVSWFEESRLWTNFPAERLRLWAENFRPEAFSLKLETALSVFWSQHQERCDDASSDPFDAYGSPHQT